MAKIHRRWIHRLLIGLCCVFCLNTTITVFAQTNLSNPVNLTAEELAYIKQNPVIRVHTEEQWAPYNFVEENQPKGFSNDYMRLIAQKVGLKVEFMTGISWEDFLVLLAEKKVDVLSNTAITEDRLKFAIFSEKPVFSLVNALLYKRGGEEFTSLAQLKGKNLAVVRSFFFQEFLIKQYPEINLLLTKSTLEGMKQVEIGKADAVLDGYANLNYYLDRNFFGNLVNHPLVDESIFAEPTPLHLAIRNDRPILKSILDKAMEAVSEEELNLLYQKWRLAIQNNDDTNFTRAELEYLQNKGKIKYCVDPNSLPMEAIRDNQHVGIGEDFMVLFHKKIGIPFILVKTNTRSESLQSLERRKCDILSLSVSSPQRQTYANFTKPYVQYPLILVNRNSEPFIVDITKIKNKKIGVADGYAYIEYLSEKYPNMQFVNVSSPSEGFDKVKRGELFGMVDFLPTASYLIQTEYPSLKIAGGFEDTWNFSLAVRNDELPLLTIFEKAIASIDEDTRQDIINQSFSVTYEKGIDYAVVRQISIGFFIVGIILFLLYRQYLLICYNKRLSYISSMDALTGCFNRLKIEEFLEQQINLNHRYQHNFSLIFYDIDHFKNVNDEYGHLAGDKVLIETTNLFRKNIRQTDLLGRWGGEEFMIICPYTTLEEAQILAESLRKHLENYYFEGIGYKTASFGVVEYINNNWSQNDLIKVADEALYQAKEKGRNCVIIGISPSP